MPLTRTFKRKRGRGRPKKKASELVRYCPCGGASGNVECKRAIICDNCGKCEYGCKQDDSCHAIHTEETVNKETRLKKGKLEYEKGKLNERRMVEAWMTPPDMKQYEKQIFHDIVSHRALSSRKATVKDLAVAFGRKNVFIENAECTVFGLRDISPSNQKKRSCQRTLNELYDIDDSTDTDESGDSASVHSDVSDDNETKSNHKKFRRSISVFRVVNNVIALILAGGQEQAKSLKEMFIQQEAKHQEEDRFLENAKCMLRTTNKSSEIHRSIKALLAKSMPDSVCLAHGLVGSRRGISRARSDYKNIVLKGKVVDRRGKPRGKSYVSDTAIANSIKVIVENCSTTAWSLRCHIIRPGNVVRSKNNTFYDGDELETIYLPAFHRKVSRNEMYQKLISRHPNENDRLEVAAFYRVATRVTRTEEKSLRALDYNLTDLLYESEKRLKRIIVDLYERSHPQDCTQLIKHLSDIYSAIQHNYPKLIGTSELSPYNIEFAIGHTDATSINGTCPFCETILQFFKERLPNAVDGKIGEHYSDIIDNCLHKAVLYMGHSLRCRVQQLQIKKFNNYQQEIQW